MMNVSQCSHRCSPHLWIRSIAVAIILLLLSSALLTNLVSGQLFLKSQTGAHVGTDKSISTISLTKHPKAHNVQITSPTKGEKVPVGKNLVISGISSGSSNSTSKLLYCNSKWNEAIPTGNSKWA